MSRMNRRKISELLRSSGNYVLSKPASSSDLLKKEQKQVRNKSLIKTRATSTTSLEPASSACEDSETDTSSEYASFTPEEERRLSLKMEPEVYIPSLQHLRDTPIDWNCVDKLKKTNIFETLITKLRNSTNPDIFIKVGTHQFSCHLILLQSYSTYFRNCKYGQVVVLPEDKVSAQGFVNVYEWMLQIGDGLEHILTRRNILDVFMSSQFLGVSELEEGCWAFIDSVIFQEETALILYMEAKDRQHSAVMDLMLPRVSACFLPLVSLEDFNLLPRDVVCTLLRSNFIAVHAEVEVFMTAVKWLSHGWEQRKAHTVELMQCVRFGFMDPWQLVDIARNPLNPEFVRVTASPEVRAMLEDGLSYAVHRYRYADNRDEYYRWMEKLSLASPEERNWLGKPRRYETYQEFLQSLEQYRSEYRGKEGLHTMWIAPAGTLHTAPSLCDTTPAEQQQGQQFHFKPITGSKSCN